MIYYSKLFLTNLLSTFEKSIQIAGVDQQTSKKGVLNIIHKSIYNFLYFFTKIFYLKPKKKYEFLIPNNT